MMRSPVVIAIAALALAACESEGDMPATAAAGAVPPAKVSVEVPKTAVRPEHFDLAGTADLVRDNRVKNGAELEVQLNKNTRNRVDVDADGKRDRLQVVEVRTGAARTLEVRAVPSSQRGAAAAQAAVPVAVVELAPAGDRAHVTVGYADVVVVDEPVVVTFDAPIVVGGFCHWVLVVERPIFIGVAVVVVPARSEHSKHKKHKQHKWK